MFTTTIIWSGTPKTIENPDTGGLGNDLKFALILDLISAIAFIVIGALAATNILNIAPGGSYVMIGLGCFQSSPFCLGFTIFAAKEKSNITHAFHKLGLIDHSL